VSPRLDLNQFVRFELGQTEDKNQNFINLSTAIV